MLAFLSLRLCLLLDFVALTIVLPLFAPNILNPDAGLLSATVSHETRVILLNALIAVYGIGQLIGAPIIGVISDNIGRKRALIVILFVTFLASLVMALGFSRNNITMLYIGRFWIGVGSGVLGVLSAAIYDLVIDPMRRKIELGYLTGAGAVGYIIGPFLGGMLSNDKIYHGLSVATPLWMLTIAYLFLILLTTMSFPSQRIINPTSSQKYYLSRIFHRFISMQSLPIFIVYFLFTFSAEAYYAAFVLFFEDKFHLSAQALGWIFAVGGLSSFICLYWLNPILIKTFPIKKLFLSEVIVMIGIYLLTMFVFSQNELFIIMIIFSAFSALAWTHIIDIISHQALPTERGEVLGAASSYRSLSIVLAPLVVIGAENLGHYYLFLLSALTIFAAVILYVSFNFYRDNGN